MGGLCERHSQTVPIRDSNTFLHTLSNFDRNRATYLLEVDQFVPFAGMRLCDSKLHFETGNVFAVTKNRRSCASTVPFVLSTPIQVPTRYIGTQAPSPPWLSVFCHSSVAQNEPNFVLCILQDVLSRIPGRPSNLSSAIGLQRTSTTMGQLFGSHNNGTYCRNIRSSHLHWDEFPRTTKRFRCGFHRLVAWFVNAIVVNITALRKCHGHLLVQI